MFYLIGSEGFLGKKIKSLLKKSKIVNISSKKIKNIIYFNFKKKNSSDLKNCLKNINEQDVVIFLSNIGSIDYHEKNYKKLIEFENSVYKNIFLNIYKKAKIVFFSSDMVYSGKNSYYKDNSKSIPINNYGKSKLRLEKIIKKRFKNSVIIRFSKIYSTSDRDKTIYSEIIGLAKLNKKNQFFTDQFVHYLDLRDFINGFKMILLNLKKLKGTYNFPGKTFTSRYKFAKSILIKHKLSLKNIESINMKEKRKYLPKKLKMKTDLFKIIKYFPKHKL